MSITRYVLLVGAMKSGTTTLFNYLAQHPAIAGSSPKEPGFFAFDDIHARGRDWYDGLFEFDPARHLWALDGSTDYSKAPFCGDVRGRMAQCDDADFRLIYLMRHPLRRIESHARHVQRTRAELGANRSDRADHGLDAGISPISLAASRYARQLDVYRDLFDQGRLLLLSLEELSADPAAVVARASAFLGLDSPPALAAPEDENRAGGRRKRAPFWDRLRAVPGLSALAVAIVPNKARRWLERRTAKTVQVSGRFRLTAGEEAALLEELGPDLIRLRDIYGFDAARHWGIALESSPPLP